MITPLSARIRGDAGTYTVVGQKAVLVSWKIGNGRKLSLAVNLADNSIEGFPEMRGQIIWQEGGLQVGGRMLLGLYAGGSMKKTNGCVIRSQYNDWLLPLFHFSKHWFVPH